MNFAMKFLSVMAGLALVACQSGDDEPSAKRTMQIAPAHWVSLPGACYKMGDSRIYPEEGPVTQVCVKPFEIRSHEITNAEFAEFVRATGYKSRAERGWSADEPGGPGVEMAPGSAVFVPPDGRPQAMNWWQLTDGANWKKPFGPDGADAVPTHPVVHLTRDDAMKYAGWAGGRLPSEAEWEYAARGGLDGELMAWSEAENKALQDQANTWQGIFPIRNTADDGHTGLAPAGSYPANGFGLFDMIGNAWEWTSSTYYPAHDPGEAVENHPEGYDPVQLNIPVGVIKGGSFLCARSYCYRYRPAARQPQDLIFGTSHIGFRIVRDKTDNADNN